MTAPAAGPAPLPASLARLLADDYRRESALTIKVLRAYPAEQAELRPHEHSNSAHQLLWTFVIENALIEGAVRHGLREQTGWGEMPPRWDDTLRLYEEGVARVTTLLDAFDDADMARSVSFFTGPKQRGEFSLFDFARYMLKDSIHHRGQMSVYLRLAGAKVPSIYGPSHDEPWR
ncbi:MAG TPA: DinB family protein [Gemmatimonadaceae bacterium]|nr:DinB family protein [Gemmatimonadaceae bacterium]